MRVMKRIPWPVWVAPFLVGMILLAARVQVSEALPETWPEGTVITVLPASADCYISEAAKTTKYGNTDSTLIQIQAPNGGGTRLRGFFKCDASSIPDTNVVFMVLLKVVNQKNMNYQTRYPVFNVRAVMRNWTESGACWDSSAAGVLWSKPGADSMLTAARADTFTASTVYDIRSKIIAGMTWGFTAGTFAAGDTMTFDITEAARRWHAGTWANHGVMIEEEFTSDPSFWSSVLLKLHSSESATTGSRPKFVWYTIPRTAFTDTLTVTETDTVTVGTGRRRVGPGRVGPQ